MEHRSLPSLPTRRSSDLGTHSIRLVTQMQDGGTGYGLAQPITLTTTWTTYETDFTAAGIALPGGVDPNARFTFFLAPSSAAGPMARLQSMGTPVGSLRIA